MTRILAGLLAVAAVATLGDYVWYEFGVRHQTLVGILHGAILLGAVGGVVGWMSGRAMGGVLVGAASGVGGALIYYALASAGGRASAMVAAWAAVWVLLAVLDGRALRKQAPRSWGEIVARGLLAAVLGAAAFYAVMDVLWGHPPAGGRNYLVQFGAWLVAWAPGILALVAGGGRRGA